MDALFTAVLENLPEAGGATVILVVLILILKSSAADRAEYRESLAAAANRHRDELVRVNADHDAELAELRADIQQLRDQIDALNKSIDVERRARREAEDVAAQAVRNAGNAFNQYLAPGSVNPRHRQGDPS